NDTLWRYLRLSSRPLPAVLAAGSSVSPPLAGAAGLAPVRLDRRAAGLFCLLTAAVLLLRYVLGAGRTDRRCRRHRRCPIRPGLWRPRGHRRSRRAWGSAVLALVCAAPRRRRVDPRATAGRRWWLLRAGCRSPRR